MSHPCHCKLGRIFSTALLLWLTGIVIGCAYAPVQEMSDARQAIQAARVAGADTVAPLKLSQAEALLDQAVVDLEGGGFEVAREKAKAAWKAAIEARQAVEHSPNP